MPIRSSQYSPEVEKFAVNTQHLFGGPVAHVETVRNDARARAEVAAELGQENSVNGVQQIEHHDGGSAKVRLEKVTDAEFRSSFYTGFGSS